MQNLVNQSLSELVNNIILYIPNLIAALIILAVGIMIGKIVYQSFLSLSELFRLDVVFRKMGMQKFFHDAGLDFYFPHTIALFFKFIVMFVVVIAALSVLGLDVVVNFIQFGLIPLVPALLNISLILFISFFVASRVSMFILHSSIVARGFSPLIARIAYFTIVFFGIVTVLDYLKFATFLLGMINLIMVALLFGLALAFGLSFGLGCREEARCMMRSWMGKDCDDLDCGCDDDEDDYDFECCDCNCLDCDGECGDCKCCDMEEGKGKKDKDYGDIEQ